MTESHAVRLHCLVNASLMRRLDDFATECGLTRTRIVEDALACFLNARDAEARQQAQNNGKGSDDEIAAVHSTRPS